MAGDKNFILATAQLARSAPQSYERFLKEFEVYADSLAKKCVQAPKNDLEIAQGRAQAAASLLDTFKTAVTQATKLEENQR